MGINLNENEEARREILLNARVIAVVGMSDDPMITSYSVGKYLEDAGYTIFPVNPTLEEIDGERVYPSQFHLPQKPDIVVVFRKPMYLKEHVEEAAKIGAPTVWAQEHVHDDEAVARALELGLNIVTDTCIRKTHRRLFNEMIEE
jgi:uncharacterized protein